MSKRIIIDKIPEHVDRASDDWHHWTYACEACKDEAFPCSRCEYRYDHDAFARLLDSRVCNTRPRLKAAVIGAMEEMIRCEEEGWWK